MQYIIRIYYEEKLYSADMTEKSHITIGSDESDTIVLDADGLKKSQIKIYENKRGLIIRGCKIFSTNGKRVFWSKTTIGKKYTVNVTPKILISIHPKYEDSEKVVLVPNYEIITIGRAKENSIVFANRMTSKNHCRIYRDGATYRIKDLNSTNGTYVNEKKIDDVELHDEDTINFSIYHMKYLDRLLYFFNVGDDMTLNISDNIEIDLDPTGDAFKQPNSGFLRGDVN